SPSTKFCGKSRTRRYAPRTQFAAKFPCRCRRRRRMSADGDDFRIFRQSVASPSGRGVFFCGVRRLQQDPAFSAPAALYFVRFVTYYDSPLPFAKKAATIETVSLSKLAGCRAKPPMRVGRKG